jgi:hypothetical protein
MRNQHKKHSSVRIAKLRWPERAGIGVPESRQRTATSTPPANWHDRERYRHMPNTGKQLPKPADHHRDRSKNSLRPEDAWQHMAAE